MRPFRRNSSPFDSDLKHYEDAKTELISRISRGEFASKHVTSYCSYCERSIPTNLAVEHIQPKKGSYAKPELQGRWSNFLLACVNCNSSKGSRGVFFDYFFFPDRDNTFNAFKYSSDGSITVNSSNHLAIQGVAKNTLWLTGLDKTVRNTYDSEGKIIAQDRISQRAEVWGIAENHLEIYTKNKGNAGIKELIVSSMLGHGYFSVWMTVFKDCPEMKNSFIDSISGTRESGCFDQHGDSSFRHSNKDKLSDSKFKFYSDKI
ncbi:HNH endonuclease [Vibrio owensii]|uniref:HNH domain-containing protein n=1 Tax=Vibrio owensii CAIM 1854 = LMG 25443 TaxID=1229493 RepID=A0A0C1VV20_9VIBR|nr:HNH endonuclease [Vibrio owensii]KIF53808.1 hypothetical protein H735_05325 [Vibrio owensii CAIM 1854 = LMG 25443]